MSRLCFIISSVGGPRLLSPLFQSHVRSDIAYLVFQHMPNDESISALIDCLQEDISHPIVFVREETRLAPGTLYFLSRSIPFRIEDNWLRPAGTAGQGFWHRPIDCLMSSAAESGIPSNVAVLSGVMIDHDGLEGVRRLKESGARVLALPKSKVPVCNMIEELETTGLIDEYLPPQSLLANLEFSSLKPVLTSERLWLVVDDEEDVRDVICNILGFHEIESDTAIDGLDALRKVQKNKYAAMILDIKMPEMDGLQTLDALQTVDPDIPILIVTGFDDIQTRAAGQKPNVKGILLKPFTGEDLRVFLPLMNRNTPASVGENGLTALQ